jgi:hypothetical protein
MYFSRYSRYLVAGSIKRKRRVLKIEFSIEISFFHDNFNYKIAKKELEKAYF